MAEKNPNIVTVEACGVSIDVDKTRLEDVRYITAMGALSDETIPMSEKMVWYVRALNVLLDNKAYDVQTALANANGGILTGDVFGEFYAELMERLAAKNS